MIKKIQEILKKIIDLIKKNQKIVIIVAIILVVLYINKRRSERFDMSKLSDEEKKSLKELFKKHRGLMAKLVPKHLAGPGYNGLDINNDYGKCVEKAVKPCIDEMRQKYIKKKEEKKEKVIDQIRDLNSIQDHSTLQKLLKMIKDKLGINKQSRIQKIE